MTNKKSRMRDTGELHMCNMLHFLIPHLLSERPMRPPYPSARPTASSAVAIGTPACASLATTVARLTMSSA